MRRTKIVSTIGPASRSPEVLDALLRAGMNVARLNFSHGTRAEHAEMIGAIRRSARGRNSPIAVLQDLAGPKVRTGPLASGPVELQPGALFRLTNRAVPGGVEEVGITYPDLPSEVRAGDSLLLGDGAIELEVVETDGETIYCRVVTGGTLAPRKGINAPTRTLSLPALTEKDREDLAFGIENGVDLVALSFVRNADDIARAREIIRGAGRETPIIAKIEKHEALESIDAILEAADGLMVARGDLGVEIPLEKVPRVQKMLIAKANRAGKPVIAATQILGSMVASPRPTRAEVTDAASAVLDGADALMLSEETAIGRYPVESVAMMSRIAVETEKEFPHDTWAGRADDGRPDPAPEAVAHAAVDLADRISAACILVCTHSGSTARLVSKQRPRTVCLAATPLEETYRRLALAWGVVPLRMGQASGIDDLFAGACAAAAASGHAQAGDVAVLVAGVPAGVPGTTNLIKVVTIGG